MTVINANQVSTAELPASTNGNILSYQNGLYVAFAAQPNIAVQYVSSSTGNDANDGTRDSPLKTLFRAISRIPDHSSGTIRLLETDVFPIQDPGMSSWGTVVATLPPSIDTGPKTVVIEAYGPENDRRIAESAGTFVFAGFLLDDIPRPVLEFGHYMASGKPMGVSLTLGSLSGQLGTIRGCELKFAASTTSAFIATRMPYQSITGSGLIVARNANLVGCKLPTPLVTSGGTSPLISVFSSLTTWQCSIPAATTNWISVERVSDIYMVASGPTVENNKGEQVKTLDNTVSDNVIQRTAGVVRDSSGTIRNVSSNIII